MITLQTLRIPRGLWTDLEDSVIQQDRRFLTEVARAFGLPVQEVLRKCLGTGANQPVQALIGEETECRCPWWSRSDDGMWQPCSRLRLTSTTPCQLHTGATTGDSLRLRSDPYMATLPELSPVLYEDEVYWVSGNTAYREDGSASAHQFRFVWFKGERICVLAPG